MDTRSKILTLAAARELPGPLAVATGFFDGLRAEQIRELQSLRDRNRGSALLAVVMPRESALLDQRARTELAAALRMVDYVVTTEDAELETFVDSLQPVEVARLEAAETRRARQLSDHVHQRQRG